jgi:hypothetical protein
MTATPDNTLPETQDDLQFPLPPDDLTALMRAPLSAQKPFPVPRASWEDKFARISAVRQAIEDLPEDLDRDTVARAVAHLRTTNIAGAFTAAMIWSYGRRAGYGAHRVQQILTNRERNGPHALDPGVADRLGQAAEVALSDGPEAAFARLNDCHHSTDPEEPCGHVHGLGPAFFTKWLHLVTRAEQLRTDACEVAVTPIMDSRATEWLRRHADRVDSAARTLTLRQEAEAQKAALRRIEEARAAEVLASAGDTSPPHCADPRHRGPLSQAPADGLRSGASWPDNSEAPEFLSRSHRPDSDGSALYDSGPYSSGLYSSGLYDSDRYSSGLYDSGHYGSGHYNSDRYDAGRYDAGYAAEPAEDARGRPDDWDQPDAWTPKPVPTPGSTLRFSEKSTQHYSRYLALLTEWGRPYALTPSEVADRIYRLLTDDGVTPVRSQIPLPEEPPAHLLKAYPPPSYPPSASPPAVHETGTEIPF